MQEYLKAQKPSMSEKKCLFLLHSRGLDGKAKHKIWLLQFFCPICHKDDNEEYKDRFVYNVICIGIDWILNLT